MEKMPMTPAGYAAIEEELKHLKSVERSAVIKAIAEAREHGDLSENAEYHAAKERQGWIESRVLELSDKMRRAEVIDLTKLSGDTVTFGAKVTLVDDDDKKQVYQIVGADEADVKLGRLSITAPLARALLGKKKGELIEVTTPGGSKGYEIAKVSFG